MYQRYEVLGYRVGERQLSRVQVIAEHRVAAGQRAKLEGMAVVERVVLLASAGQSTVRED